jgi:histidinol-phosphatase
MAPPVARRVSFARMSAPQNLDADLDLALRLADAARTISLARFRGTFEKRIKADGSVVTEVDEAVEDELRRLLARERPDDAILGEERGASGSGDRRWLIDAIDGTHAFAEGAVQWGTLIGLEVAGKVVVGVCDDSPLDRRYWASKGRGAYRADAGSTPLRLRVSDTSDLAEARSFVQPEQWVRTPDARAMSAAFAAATKPTSAEDHPALQVAFGGYDVAVFFAAGPWDLAAPSIVVEEAGGKFSDLTGGATLTGGAVFSNGRLHDATVRLLREARRH